MKAKRRILAALAAMLLLALLGGGLWLHREAQRREAERLAAEEAARQRELDAVTEFSGVLTVDELPSLEQYRNLRTLDLRGSTCYAAILDYAREHPEQELRYTVDLGGTEAESGDEALSLAPGAFRFETLEENLRWLPALRELHFPRTALSAAQLASLREKHPGIRFSWTAELLGQEIPDDTAQLDLSMLAPDALDEALTALELLPALERVELTSGEGENLLTPEEVQRLQEARPGVLFVYRFELFGQTLSTEDERIEYVRVPIGNEGVDALRRVLPILGRCSYFLLDRCGIDNELLAALRDEFPQTKIVWRLYIEYIGLLTDIKVLHLTWMWNNQNIQILRYCNEMEYFDIGHNTISDISFMAYMPNLKYAILSYNWVRDLTPLSNCKKLEMLELYFCHLLEDISPLAECENLKMLNISATRVHDISPVFGLKKLERFYCIMNYGIPAEQQEQIYEELPDCWITFDQQIDKAVGWSFDAAGGVRAQWYLDMYQIFRYRVKPYFFGDYPEEFQNGA